MKLSLEQFADEYQPTNTDPVFLRGWELVRNLFDAPGHTEFRILEFLDFLKENREQGYVHYAGVSYEDGDVAFHIEGGRLYIGFVSEEVVCSPDDFVNVLELVVEAYNAQPES
jgi:hypothetical protein